MLLTSTLLGAPALASAPQDAPASSPATSERYDALLYAALTALAGGKLVEGEKLAFSLTVIDESRADGFAALGIALKKQGKDADAREAFRNARAKASSETRKMFQLMEAMGMGGGPSPAEAPAPAPAPAPSANAALGWCEVLAADPDRAVVTDTAARERMMATKLPWKVRDRKTGIVMLLCPPGEFMMGSPASEGQRSNDEVQHRVAITNAFYLSETEVTQESWQKVMGANPSYFKADHNPVETVSWNDCQRFCQASGLRLPSESEWEYACRAGTTTPYCFGATVDSERVNYDASYPYGSTPKGLYRQHPVACGSLPSNAWGFHEMHGNICEWCGDEYDEAASVSQEAHCGSTGMYVIRSGSWYSAASSCRSAFRRYSNPSTSTYNVGIRVARFPQ